MDDAGFTMVLVVVGSLVCAVTCEVVMSGFISLNAAVLMCFSYKVGSVGFTTLRAAVKLFKSSSNLVIVAWSGRFGLHFKCSSSIFRFAKRSNSFFRGRLVYGVVASVLVVVDSFVGIAVLCAMSCMVGPSGFTTLRMAVMLFKSSCSLVIVALSGRFGLHFKCSNSIFRFAKRLNSSFRGRSV